MGVAGAVVAVVVLLLLPLVLLLAAPKPLGRSVAQGLKSHLRLCPTWTTQRPSQPWLKPLAAAPQAYRSLLSTSTMRLACSWILQQSEMMEKRVINYGTQCE